MNASRLFACLILGSLVGLLAGCATDEVVYVDEEGNVLAVDEEGNPVVEEEPGVTYTWDAVPAMPSADESTAPAAQPAAPPAATAPAPAMPSDEGLPYPIYVPAKKKKKPVAGKPDSSAVLDAPPAG